MPLKNYTTIVPASRSIDEIQQALVKHGATGILYEYEQGGGGRVAALRFRLPMADKDLTFSLPVEWRRFQAVLKKQRVPRSDNEDYVYRVAWRNIRDWVLAQLALYETRIVELPQVFLPYATGSDGRTLYEKVVGDPRFLLGDGNNNNETI
jgi:hypothetical protein